MVWHWLGSAAMPVGSVYVSVEGGANGQLPPLCEGIQTQRRCRTATAAAAYRTGERIECQREGRLHDYTRNRQTDS